MVDIKGFGSPNKKDSLPQFNEPPPGMIETERRIKVLEENISGLRRKIVLNEQNDISRHKKVLLEEKTTQSEINDLKKEIINIKQSIRELISELKSSAKREEVEVLKRYVEMWDPTNFVTQNEIDNIIEEKLQKTKEE